MFSHIESDLYREVTVSQSQHTAPIAKFYAKLAQTQKHTR